MREHTARVHGLHKCTGAQNECVVTGVVCRYRVRGLAEPAYGLKSKVSHAVAAEDYQRCSNEQQHDAMGVAWGPALREAQNQQRTKRSRFTPQLPQQQQQQQHARRFTQPAATSQTAVQDTNKWAAVFPTAGIGITLSNTWQHVPLLVTASPPALDTRRWTETSPSPQRATGSYPADNTAGSTRSPETGWQPLPTRRLG